MRYEYKNLTFDYQETADIMTARPPADFCFHLLCRHGAATIIFEDHPFDIKKNDVLIISKPAGLSGSMQTADFKAEAFSARLDFLNRQLPANNYAIGGSISLYNDPVLHLSDRDAEQLLNGMRAIRNRLPETAHPFYPELIGSLCLTMMYDLFSFHMANRPSVYATERNLYVVKELMAMLEAGHSRQHRSVAWYAKAMNVTSKYLSETVRRHTGHSVSYHIDRATVPLIKEMLDNPRYSITQIAEEMNFGTPAYFSRYVSQRLGISPKRYRSSRMSM